MNVYERLGVRQYINAAATLTRYGGSIMPKEVLQAMEEASQSYVDIIELQEKVGAYIARLTHNEAAFVSNGAASGILLATAAAITAYNQEKRNQLPFSDGLKNEIVLSKAGRVGYDYAIKMAGGKYVPYGDEYCGTEKELEEAITEKTAAIFMFYFEHRMQNQPSLKKQIEIARKYKVPLFVDAAAQLPKKENLWRFTQEGADLAIFSGGKGLRGPQSSGLIVGREKWIGQIRSIASPNPGIGRPMKVGKEEIVGLMTAIELFMQQDENRTLKSYEQTVQTFIEAFAQDDAIAVTRDFPSEAGQPMPRAKIVIQPNRLRVDAVGFTAQLRQCRPAILAFGHEDTFYINPQTLLTGETETIIEKMREVLAANRL